jgi:DNA mismatch repair ATPase MutS
VLRGTNSEDKYHGSYQLIEKLMQNNCLVVMATHDLKLSKLEESQGDKVVNYCFEGTINGGNLSFDYKIRKGVSASRNATWLMKKMGIV